MFILYNNNILYIFIYLILINISTHNSTTQMSVDIFIFSSQNIKYKLYKLIKIMWKVATDFLASIDRDVFMMKLGRGNRITAGGTF